MRTWIDNMLLVISTLSAIGTITQEVAKASTLGWNSNIWVAIGLGIFFICIIALVYRLEKRVDNLQESKVNKWLKKEGKGITKQ